jgi:hypothetical protein
LLSPSLTIHLPARPPCPSSYVPTVDFPCNAPSRTTLARSKAKARCGISRVQVGVSQEISPCDLGNPSR